jgi:hypothetical protein
LTWPAPKHAWPKSALCWSPATPPIGIDAPSRLASVRPYGWLDGCTAGSSGRGIASAASSSSLHAPAWMSKSSVREALLASVACTALPRVAASPPPVSIQISQLSTVPKASSPRSAAARAPATLSSSQASLVPEK